MVAGLLEQLPQPLLSSPNPLTAMELGLVKWLGLSGALSASGEVLVRTPNMPNQNMLEYATGFHEINFSGERWRTFTLKRENLSV